MTRKRSRLAALLAAAGLGILCSVSVPSAGAAETARVPAIALPTAHLPTVLNSTDIDLYRRIFAVQEDGDWRTADALIAKLSDRVLIGHVLYQRYMHPTKYRSKYAELKDWMQDHADLPDADRVYALALSRKPGNWLAPTPPVRLAPSQAIPARPDAERIRKPSDDRSAAERSRARSILYSIKRALRSGHTLVAKQIIERDDAQRLLSKTEYDDARADLAKGYFIDGEDERAFRWLMPALARSGDYLPEGHWTAGLLLWRAEKYDEAARHFASAANNPDVSEWLSSAASFWAARAYHVAHQPADVLPLLEKAAKHPRTFYGLLATRLLGRDLPFQWAPPEFKPDTLRQLMDSDRGRRAIALMQIGDDTRAESELRELARGADLDLMVGIHALVARGNMASLAVSLDRMLYPDGGGYDGAAYPIPEFAPSEGFSIDRALVYALIRQESAFNPNAKSWAGARGLMQLMPGTARFVARSSGLHLASRNTLYTPETNLELGQRYIEMLLDEQDVEGNLFKLAVAWNGGPGNLRKWKRRTKYLDDPIFFIESIPSYETRNFVERVLTNFWIYRHRFGQQAPSLDAVARGEWPLYTALGHGDSEVAINAAGD